MTISNSRARAALYLGAAALLPPKLGRAFLLLVCIELSRDFSFKINFTAAGRALTPRLDEPLGKSRKRNKLSGFSRPRSCSLPAQPSSRRVGM